MMKRKMLSAALFCAASLSCVGDVAPYYPERPELPEPVIYVNQHADLIFFTVLIALVGLYTATRPWRFPKKWIYVGHAVLVFGYLFLIPCLPFGYDWMFWLWPLFVYSSLVLLAFSCFKVVKPFRLAACTGQLLLLAALLFPLVYCLVTAPLIGAIR